MGLLSGLHDAGLPSQRFGGLHESQEAALTSLPVSSRLKGLFWARAICARSYTKLLAKSAAA